MPECKGSSIPVAECSLSYQIVKASDTAGREKGGMSLGAGLRIKNIKIMIQLMNCLVKPDMNIKMASC